MKYIYGKRDAPDGAGLFIGLLNKDNSIDKNLTRFVMRLADSEYYGAAEPPVRCGESHQERHCQSLRLLCQAFMARIYV